MVDFKSENPNSSTYRLQEGQFAWIASLARLVLVLLGIAHTQALGQENEGQVKSELQKRLEKLLPSFVLVHGGEYTIGSDINNPLDRQFFLDEQPIKIVVGDFLIATTPVTAEQYCEFLNSSSAEGMKTDDLYALESDSMLMKYSPIIMENKKYIIRERAKYCPANLVTWKGAVRYCEWLSRQLKEQFRLPTEGEWEIAVRGHQRRKWPWGIEDPDATRGFRWDANWHANESWYFPPVGSYPKGATPEGILDVLSYYSGEWCLNKYSSPLDSTVINASTSNLNDLESPRAVRGFLDKETKLGYYDYALHGGSTEGMVWSRKGAHPQWGAYRTACFGFRIVQEKKAVPNTTHTIAQDTNNKGATNLILVAFALICIFAFVVMVFRRMLLSRKTRLLRSVPSPVPPSSPTPDPPKDK